MTEDEELQGMSAALAAADNDPWSPRCVAEAFVPESLVIGPWSIGPLTMRGWLCLDKARSPFVTGVFPEEVEARVGALCAAISILAGVRVGVEDLRGAVSAEEALKAELMVCAWINNSFATALPMHRPARPGEEVPPAAREHGFGWWIKVLTKLISELHQPLPSALEMPLGQAFALLAVQALLDGCEPRELNYREREALSVAEPTGGPVAEEPENDGGDDEGGGGADGKAPGQPGEEMPAPEMVEPRDEQADGGGDSGNTTHGENVA